MMAHHSIDEKVFIASLTTAKYKNQLYFMLHVQNAFELSNNKSPVWWSILSLI